MANNYLQYSTIIPLTSLEESKWFKAILDGEVRRRPAWANKILKEICEDTGNSTHDGYTGQYAITCKLDENGRFVKAGSNVWFYSEEGDEPYHVALIMQAYLKQFHPKQVLGFTWSATCSKMRLDEFSGGYIAVSAVRITAESAETTLTKVMEDLLAAVR